MLFNRKSNLLKKIQSYLMILFFVGLLASLPGHTVSAQSVENLESPIPRPAGMSETPGFIDDGFVPALTGRRRALHDFVSGTRVVPLPLLSGSHPLAGDAVSMAASPSDAM